ncbi:MAG TPA: hypothetical protein VFK33_13365 [Bacillales bacterium]|nr:hypothetical protein [Bacillales bacterium]
MQLNDFDWGMYLSSRGSLFKKMTGMQIKQVIEGSLKCAEEQFEKFRSTDLLDFAKAETIRIQEDDSPVQEAYLQLAFYKPKPPLIQISTKAIERIKDVIIEEQLSSLLGEVDLRRLVIAHEMFHHIESKEPEIFTQKPNVELKRFGRFRYRTRVTAASEMAAVHFSKLKLGLDYNPAVIEILLTYSVDQQRARAIMGQLIGEKWG